MATWSGLWSSVTFIELIGVGIATGIPSNTRWSEAYSISSGAVLTACFDGFGGFGSLCVVILALGAIQNIAPSTYVAATSIQVSHEILIWSNRSSLYHFPPSYKYTKARTDLRQILESCTTMGMVYLPYGYLPCMQCCRSRSFVQHLRELFTNHGILGLPLGNNSA